MKKVVVVVNNVNDTREEFKGEDLKVINKAGEYMSMVPVPIDAELLIVMDGDKELAVFRKWEYWKLIE